MRVSMVTSYAITFRLLWPMPGFSVVRDQSNVLSDSQLIQTDDVFLRN